MSISRQSRRRRRRRCRRSGLKGNWFSDVYGGERSTETREAPSRSSSSRNRRIQQRNLSGGERNTWASASTKTSLCPPTPPPPPPRATPPTPLRPPTSAAADGCWHISRNFSACPARFFSFPDAPNRSHWKPPPHPFLLPLRRVVQFFSQISSCDKVQMRGRTYRWQMRRQSRIHSINKKKKFTSRSWLVSKQILMNAGPTDVIGCNGPVLIPEFPIT